MLTHLFYSILLLLHYRFINCCKLGIYTFAPSQLHQFCHHCNATLLHRCIIIRQVFSHLLHTNYINLITVVNQVLTRLLYEILLPLHRYITDRCTSDIYIFILSQLHQVCHYCIATLLHRCTSSIHALTLCQLHQFCHCCILSAYALIFFNLVITALLHYWPLYIKYLCAYSISIILILSTLHHCVATHHHFIILLHYYNNIQQVVSCLYAHFGIYYQSLLPLSVLLLLHYLLYCYTAASK